MNFTPSQIAILASRHICTKARERAIPEWTRAKWLHGIELMGGMITPPRPSDMYAPHPPGPRTAR